MKWCANFALHIGYSFAISYSGVNQDAEEVRPSGEISVVYDPNCPEGSLPPSPGGSVHHHHHHFHRIVGRVRPRPKPIVKVAANNPPPTDAGCERPVAGHGPGKIAPIVGAGGAAAIGTGLITNPPGTPTHTTPVTPVTPISVVPPGIVPPGNVVVPPIPPVIVVPPNNNPPTNPTPVPEPTTIVIFAMALAALWLARFLAQRHTTAAIAR